MKSPTLVGFMVELKGGGLLEANAAGGVVPVFSKDRLLELEEDFKKIGLPYSSFINIYAEDILDIWEQGNGPALAFDQESFRAFDPLAKARFYVPVGTFLYSLTREPIENEDSFVIFSTKNSES